MRLIAAIAALAALPAIAAEEDPPPFWLAPESAEAPAVAEPPKKRKAKEKKKKARKPRTEEKPVEEPVAEERPARREKKRKAQKREWWDAPLLKQKRAEEPAPRPVAPPPAPMKREEPAVVRAPPPEPPVETPPPPEPPVKREEDLLVKPLRERPPIEPPAPAVILPKPIEPAPRAPEPAPVEAPAAVVAAPPLATAESRPPVVAPGPAEERAAQDARSEVPALRRRRGGGSAVAFGGVWSAPDSIGGRRWDLAFGARLALDLGSGFAAEAYAAHAGASGGNPYTNLSATRSLLGLRGGYWLFERGMFAAQVGGGVGVALSQQSYGLRDVGGQPQSLEGSSLKLAPEVGAALRLRPLRFVELRLDAMLLLRDRRLEAAAGLGAGAWVAF